jgi:hypothetical protein
MGWSRYWNLGVMSELREWHRHGMDGLTEGNAYEMGRLKKANSRATGGP